MDQYPKIPRISVTGLRLRGKRYLDEAEVIRLLEGSVVIEEKIDGSNEIQVVDGYAFFGENLKWVHAVEYRDLPAYFVVFDIWDGQRFLSREEKEEVAQILGVPVVPLIFMGCIGSVEELLQFLGRPSDFGAERIEGIVVKNYAQSLFAKVVDPLFEDVVDSSGHWRRRPWRTNRLVARNS